MMLNKRGLRAFLKEDKLAVIGRIYNLDYVVKNIQLGVEGIGLEIPVRNTVEGSEEISQQARKNAGPGYINQHIPERQRYLEDMKCTVREANTTAERGRIVRHR
jgi:hypothetical protein